MGHFTAVINDLKEPTRTLSRAIPHAWSGFGELPVEEVSSGGRVL
jgi:hypothetical protein